MVSETLKNKAYSWLKKKIITLKLPMGSALVESELCRELNMGRTPVREALQQLESEGLVSILPRKGSFVSNISFVDFEKLLDVRIMLETHVVKRLAGSITIEQIAHLQSLFININEQIDNRDVDQLLSIDRQFHQGLVTLLDNSYLDSIAENLYDLVARTWYLSFQNRNQDGLANTVQDHIELLELLEKGDAEASDKMVRDHVQSFRKKVFLQPMS
jgi:DNA-binding GntR family transcriptional regulator